jgi:16S rRNA processing protein RimM
MKDTPVPRSILLGQIASAHGIRGDVMIRTYTETPEAIASYGALTDSRGQHRFEIKVQRVTDKGVVAHIKGVDDRTAAEALRGVELYVDRDHLPATSDDEFYHADLIGLDAITGDGQPFGTVIAVQNFGAGDLLEIRRPGRRDTDYIPFTNDCVPDVDIGNRRIVVEPPVMIGDPEPLSGVDDEEQPSGDPSSRD